MSTDIESASASHRGAAASLLDQVELHRWRLHCNGNHTHTLAWLDCRRAGTSTHRTLSPPPPRTKEQSQACLSRWRSVRWRLRRKGTKTILHVRGWLKCRRQRRARTLRPQSHKPGGRRTSLLDQVERSMAAALQRHKARPSASTSYRIAVLLTQVERQWWRLRHKGN